MTAKDVIQNQRLYGAFDPRECFLYIANHAHEVKLNDGQRLLDLTDFTQFMIELSEATRPLGIRELHKTCGRCGHIHQGTAECGELMGGDRVCRCEMEVPA